MRGGVFYIVDKAFPELKFEVATREEVEFYKANFMRKMGQKLDDCLPPVYIGGYPSQRSAIMVSYRDFFKSHFKPSLKNSTQKLLEQIKATNSCGVHCRRGDLSEFHPVYGHPASVEYFLKAISIVNKLHENVHFYFFSDTPSWIKEQIVQHLDGVNFTLCDENNANDGYIDLYLLTWCKFIISSNGSLGTYGKLLSHTNAPLIMCKYRNLLCETEGIDEIYMINDARTATPKILSEVELEFGGCPVDDSEVKKFRGKYKRYKRWCRALLCVSGILLVSVVVLAFKI